MRLMSALVGFGLRKLYLFVALVVSLFVVSQVLLPFFDTTVRGNLADRQRLPGEIAVLEEDLEQLPSLEEARERQDDECGGLKGIFIDAFTPNGAACKAAKNALKAVESKERELAAKKLEQEKLNGGIGGWLIYRWLQSWKTLATIAVLVLVFPIAVRIVGYFLLMPIVRRVHKPIHLAAGSKDATADLRTSAAERTLTIRLDAGEVLSARSEYVRPVQGQVHSRLLFQGRSPFISFAAGLYGLSRIVGDEGGSSATLGAPNDPASYLMRIDFEDHPGVVMHLKHVVGVIGTPELTTRWRWGIPSFATWQVRYIMFAGTGSLIVQGSGDVVAGIPGDKSTRMNQNLVMGFDSRLTVGVNRTEVFLPYLRGKAPLVDDEFTGSHPFLWQKSSADGPRNPVAKTFGAVFSGVGKLLGF